jgi:hypothetical protein
VKLSAAVAVGAGLVALAFTMLTFERWLARRQRHELAWSASLALFAVAAGTLAMGAQGGWNGATFRIFYLCGAVIDVPFLALGTVYLLAGPRLGDRVAVGVCLVAAFAAGVVAVAPFTHPLPAHRLVQGSAVFGPAPRVLAGVCSGVGALVVFAGAVWSAWRQRRARSLLSNGLIAAGTALLGASGLLNSVLDAMTAFAVTLLIGICVLFAGFLVATGGSGGNRRFNAQEPGGSSDRRGPPTPGVTPARPVPLLGEYQRRVP